MSDLRTKALKTASKSERSRQKFLATVSDLKERELFVALFRLFDAGLDELIDDDEFLLSTDVDDLISRFNQAQ